MESLRRVIKVDKSGSSEALNLRRIFATCGDIRAIHASGFIEFADVASAERAVSRRLDMPEVRVYEVASQPRLVEQYRVINPSAFAGDDLIRSSTVRNDSGSRLDPPRSSAPATGLLHALKSSDALISLSSRSATETSRTAPSFRLPSASPSTPASPPSLAFNPSPCIQDHILIRLCGENITLDLRSLAGNPAAVIELLKLTSSERGNWLTVGAYYRRVGNAEGAKAVINAMLEALKQFNIPESNLKPAFLLLSGCEGDLAKIARLKGDSDKVSEHSSNSQQWLQKVYGAHLPPEPPTPNESKETSRVASPPRAPSSLRSRIDSRPYPLSPDHRVLEREIQSLRDRNAHNADIIAEMRSSKRKLEDAVETARDVRRRLERQLDEVVKERDVARRMESAALDQLERVESRRRAETRASEEGERAAYMSMPRMTPMDGRDFDSARISF